MAILINAETQTVVVLDRHDRIDGNALALLSAQAVDRPPRAATGPRDYAAAMRLVEREVYATT